MPSGKNAIYLASRSPRRRELLRQIGIAFDVLDVPVLDTAHADMVDETVRPGESPLSYVSRMAREKALCAMAYLKSTDLEKRPVLTADTTVVSGEEILGKPADREEAVSMMKRLSGRTHRVLTAVAVITEKDFFHAVRQSDVTFASLTDEEIRAYAESGEPYDKAGGYGIQGKAGKFISSISGSYSGIMGLPLYETAELLKKAGIRL